MELTNIILNSLLGFILGIVYTLKLQERRDGRQALDAGLTINTNNNIGSFFGDFKLNIGSDQSDHTVGGGAGSSIQSHGYSQ